VADGPGEVPAQDVHPARDAFVADGDFHYHAAGSVPAASTGRPLLVVFDNAAQVDALRPYMPAGGRTRILITSNRQSLAELGDPLEVEEFTKTDSLTRAE
jgi:hypothetical protein